MTERRRNGFVLRIKPGGLYRVPEALESNHLIIGWGSAEGLLDGNLDWHRFRQIIADEYYSDPPNLRAAGNAAGQMWRFIREMSPQDLVIVPDGPVFHIGEVSGCALYDETNVDEDTAYRRPVRWRNNKRGIPRSMAKSALLSRMKARGTCTSASDLVEEIEECAIAAERGERPSFAQDLKNRLVRETLNELRSGRIGDYGFELLIEKLLFGLGAVNTKVIPRNQDKGIDVVATFQVAGTFRVVVGVQAKHYGPEPPVDGAVVQQLAKGIEEGGEGVTHGMIITSGTIGDEAAAEAECYSENTGILIDLVDGEQLATLIVEHGLRITRHD